MSDIKKGYIAEIENVVKSMEETLDLEPYHRVSLATFERTYLPILKPLLAGGELDSARWLAVAEHPLIGIEVYKEGDEPIFRIQSFLKGTSTASAPLEDPTISEIALDLPSLTSDSPAMSRSFFSKLLEKTLNNDDRTLDKVGVLELGKVADYYNVEGPYKGLVVDAAKAGVEEARQEERDTNLDDWDDL